MILILIVLGFLGKTVFEQYKNSKRCAGILRFPFRSGLVEKEKYYDYLIPGLDLKALGVDYWNIDSTVLSKASQDSSRVFYSIRGLEEEELHQKEVSALFKMEQWYLPMARQISKFTDNLAYHDCLYYPVLLYLFRGDTPLLPVLECEQKRAFNRWYRVIAKKELALQKIFSKEIEDFSFVSQKEETDYCVVFRSKRNAISYAFSTIRMAEKDWGLYYYPTLLIDTEEINCEKLSENEDGELCSCEHRPLCSTVNYVRLPNGYYARVISGRRLRNDDMMRIREYLLNYHEVTQTMNALLQDFFNRL